MRFLLLLCLTLGTARAELMFEQIAEFNLPPGSSAWDIQHWMDDSTYGWVAVVGDWGNQQIIFERRIGEERDTLILGDTLCDGTGNLFRLYAIAIVKGDDEHVYFAITASVQPFDGYTILVMNPESGNDDCFHYPWDNCWWTGSSGLVPRELNAWPPPPARTQKVILSAVRGDYCDSMGDNDGWYYGRTYVLNLSPFELFLNVPNVYSMRPKEASDTFKVIGPGYYYRLYDEDRGPITESLVLRWTMLSHFDGTVLHVDTTCHEEVWFDPYGTYTPQCESLGYAIGASATGEARVAVHQRVFNGTEYVRGTVCYDLATFEPVWETTNFLATYEVAYPGSGGNVIWDGNSRVLYSFEDGSAVDTVNPIAWFSRTLDTALGDTKFIRRVDSGQSRLVSIHRISHRPIQLTISLAAIGRQTILRWRSISGALRYQVCRNIDFSDDLCANGEIYSTTDTTMVLTPWSGATREYYSVSPVFE